MSELTINAAIYEGRPADCGDRLPKEVRTYDFLDRLGIPYHRVDHRAADTIADCDAIERLLGIHICKNLFLCNTQKTNFYLFLTPGAKKFKTSVFSKLLGCARLSFADACFMEELLDITPGSVSIMGLINDQDHRIHLVIDEDVLKEEYIGCHPCINTSSLKIKTSDVIRHFLPATGHDYTIVNLEENVVKKQENPSHHSA